MDTKSKNIKYKLGTKVIATMVMWLSVVGIFATSFFLLSNTDMIRESSYEDTYEYQSTINRLIHNTVELGTHFKHGKIKEDESGRYRTIDENLSQAVNFNYYMKDLETGEISYQITGDHRPERIKDRSNLIYIDKDQIPYYLYDHHDIEKMLKESPQELYVALNDPLVPGDGFYDVFTRYTQVKAIFPYAAIGLMGSLIGFLISFTYLLIVSGRKEKDGDIYLAGIDRIYNDVQSLFLLMAAMISVILMSNYLFRWDKMEFIVVVVIFAIDAAIGMTYFFSMVRQFKKGVLLKNTLGWKLLSKGIHLAHMCFNEKIFKGWMIGLMLLYGLINGILFNIAGNRWGFFALMASILIILLNAVAVYIAFQALRSLTIIMDGAKEISNGNLDVQIGLGEISMAFQGFAQDIQSIQGGLKNSVQEAIKGERMKTDLITNVSHDLKTPLTSIINYVDLLKQENIDNEKAASYLNILDDKSNRLKQLIEDLIEASKASSGNLEIKEEQVDLNELVTQACGEYEEKIKEAQLDLRMNTSQEKIWILADGKYMWRILENIMSNVLKYSMAHSRVYMDIESKDGYGVLVMKNISAYPLDIDPDQLTDRFVRAEESRTTEGSGLGLSIAQSLASIQGGTFNIDIDGDLFKVTVKIPLCLAP